MPIELEGPQARRYRDCAFCFGKGCFSCDARSERECKAAFENPLYTGNPANVPEDRERLETLMSGIFGAKACEVIMQGVDGIIAKKEE